MLAMEIPFDHGLIDGTVMQWNEKGELLGTSQLRRGTGIHRSWYENGQLRMERSLVDGKCSGRFRTYWDDGELVEEHYELANNRVSKKRYLEACKRDPSLPRYGDSEASSTPHRLKAHAGVKKSKSIGEGPRLADEIATKLLAGPEVREALSWLAESKRPTRSLGEDLGQSGSLRLVKKLYALGAVKVHAVEIDGAPYDHQNSGRLVLELPADSSHRKAILRYCARWARKLGFDPDREGGQRYMLLMLD
jgi:hypothetical protein